MNRVRSMTAAAILGLAAAGTAAAQTTYNAPWRGDFWGYLGASAGESKFRAECNRTITQFDCDRKDTGFKVYAGGNMSEIFGLEIGYTDFGRIRTGGGETDAWAVPLTLRAGIPMGERFSAFAKVGGLYGRTDVSASLASLTATGHKQLTFETGRWNRLVDSIARVMEPGPTPENT